jgi:hypothetical protein
LHRQLLRAGGVGVDGSAQAAWLVEGLLARGELFRQKPTHWGERPPCWGNAAGAWGRWSDVFRLAAGFVLGADDLWVRHTWLMAPGSAAGETVLVDLADPSRAYYGIVLDEDEALQLWGHEFFEEFALWPLGDVAAALTAQMPATAPSTAAD